MRKFIFIIAAFAVTLTTISWAGGFDMTITPGQKLYMAESAISQVYVDTVNEEELVEAAIKGMLERLDPHSSYSNAEETRELNEPLAGNFSGVGIQFNMNRDTLYVIQTTAGGPSEKVGIMAGDRIISVNDTAIAGVGMKNSQIIKKLRGPKGTEVKVTALRRERGATDTLDFLITRADIPIYSVDAAYMADPKTGYIRLNKFGIETSAEVSKALDDLRKQGMEQLILDLSDNGGGLLNAAVDLLGEFLPQGSLAVFTEGRTTPRTDLLTGSDNKKPSMRDGRLVVMVNQNSASAAEITAGGIQDWDRGLIVGRRTFGKGLVQRPIPFPDGSMIRLTVSHYYTPAGRDIQRPYEKGKKEAYALDFMDRFKNGELMHADSIHQPDSLRVFTKRLGRSIYGGGGITPDLFVGLDTTEFTKYYRSVVAKGLINRYVIQYVDEHRKALKKEYRDDSQFVRDFKVTDQMLSDLYALAEKEGIEQNPEEARTSEPLFKMSIKGLIGRDIFESGTYFKVYNEHDPVFREALRLINSSEYDSLLSPSKN